MNPQRSAQVLGLAQTVFLAGWMVAWLAGFGSAGPQTTSIALIEDRLPSMAAAVELVNPPRAPAVARAAVDHAARELAELATAREPAAELATKPTVVPDQPKQIAEPAPAAASQIAPSPAPAMQVAALSVPDPTHEAAPDEPQLIAATAPTAASQAETGAAPTLQLAAATPSDRLPNDVMKADAMTGDVMKGDVMKAVGTLEAPAECSAADGCIDRYLWALYQRTPKEDSIKVEEQRKVTVKKKGKMVTVTKSFTTLMDEDFGWKDPKAAERVGMPIMDYVVGGMDGSFKLKLFNLLRAAEQAGLAPGITSAFRDDYRQSIASGLKAASDRSYHGGSSRGGYGHGLAADVVSIKGETRDQRYASSEALWKWIDAHGEAYGIGRPYLDRDPPHVAPIDGKEYASHRGAKVQHAAVSVKKPNATTGRHDHNAKLPKTARSVKVGTT